MEELLKFLTDNYDDCPFEPLVNAHFRIHDGDIVSQPLTMSADMHLFPADWDETTGELSIGKLLHSTSVDVMAEGNNLWISSAKGLGAWQQVEIFALSDRVLRWLLNAVPSSASILCDLQGGQLAGSSMCPQERSTEPQPEIQHVSSKESIPLPPSSTTPPKNSPQTTQTKLGGRMIVAIILGIVFISGCVFLCCKWFAPSSKLSSVVLSDRAFTLPQHATTLTGRIVSESAWIDL